MESLPINVLDLIVIIVLVLSGIAAFMRGFVREVLGIAAWIGAFFAALYGFSLLSPMFRDLAPSAPWVADWIAGILIFVLTLVALYILSGLISKTVRETVLGPLDRSLGFVFGLFRGWLIMVALILGLNWIIAPGSQPNWLRDAVTRPMLDRSAAMVIRLLPSSLSGVRDAFLQDIRLPTPEDQIREAQRQFDRLLSPNPVSANVVEDEVPAYGTAQRNELDRLIHREP